MRLERDQSGRTGATLVAVAVVLLALTAAVAQAASDTLGKTTLEQRIVPAGPGEFRTLTLGPGEPYVLRTGVGAAPKNGRAARRVSLSYFGQLSDFQLADEESPARVEFLDPAGPPVDAAWRPWEALNPHIDDAEIRQINAFAAASTIAAGNGSHRAMDYTINTGDSADSMQRNETLWVRTLMEGGPLDPGSGIDPAGYDHPLCTPFTAMPDFPTAAEAPLYTGVQDYDDYNELADPYFYDPDDPRGNFSHFPEYTGLMDRAQVPFTAAGLTMPSYVAFGNHDALVQGNAAGNSDFERIGTGCIKAMEGAGSELPNPLAPTPQDVIDLLDSSPSRASFVPPDPQRQFVSKKQYKEIFKTGAQADGHGFDYLEAAEETASGGAAGYYSFEPVPGLRMVSVDTVCEGGVIGPCSDGNVDDPQFRWLERELAEATAADDLVVLFSHHAIQSLTADVPDEAAPPCTSADTHGHDVNPGCDLDPRDSSPIHLGEDMTELVHRFPHVIAWVAGHSHVNDIVAYPNPRGGGFWMIRTAAEADWPQQSRLIELFENRDGTLSIFGTILDHASPATAAAGPADASSYDVDTLASVGRTLSFNDNQTGGSCMPNPCGEGTVDDRNVELLVKDPRRTKTVLGPCPNYREGTNRSDRLRGTPRADLLRGLGGSDKVKGFGAGDCLFGGRGADQVKGGRGNDRVFGQRQPDRVVGGPGADVLKGNGGRDRLLGGRGRDRLLGGLDRDFLRAADGVRDIVLCGPGRDRAVIDRRDVVRGCEGVTVRRGPRNR